MTNGGKCVRVCFGYAGQFSFAGDAGGGGYSDDEAGGFEPPPNLPTPHRESTVKTTDKVQSVLYDGGICVLSYM